MTYTDANTISNPTTGQPILAAWGDQIRTNQEFFIDPPGCSIYNSATQSVPTGTGATALTADSENYDNDSMHSTSANTSRITIQTSGRYLFVATVVFAANSSGYRRISLRVDGATSYGGLSGIVDSSNSGVRLTASRSLVLSAGQYVEVTAVQTSGGNLNVTLEECAAMYLTR